MLRCASLLVSLLAAVPRAVAAEPVSAAGIQWSVPEPEILALVASSILVIYLKRKVGRR